MTVFFLAALAFTQIPQPVETPAQARAESACEWTDTAVRTTVTAPTSTYDIGAEGIGNTQTTTHVREDVVPADRSESGLLADAVRRAQHKLAGCIARAAYARDVEATAIMRSHPADDTAVVAVLYLARIVGHRHSPQHRRVRVTLEVPYVTPDSP